MFNCNKCLFFMHVRLYHFRAKNAIQQLREWERWFTHFWGKKSRDRIWRKWPCVTWLKRDYWFFFVGFHLQNKTIYNKRSKRRDKTMGMVPPLCCCRWSFWRSPQGNNSLRFCCCMFSTPQLRTRKSWNLLTFVCVCLWKGGHIVATIAWTV